MIPLTLTIFNSSCSSWLNFLRHWPVLESLIRPHILRNILFSKVFSLRCVTLVVVHTSQPYVSIGLIIDVYSLIFVRLDLKNFNKAKNALSTSVILDPISRDQPFFVLSSIPRY